MPAGGVRRGAVAGLAARRTPVIGAAASCMEGPTMTPLALAEPSLDMLGIGNAIVDVLAPVPAGFPQAQGMIPGSMSLIDAARADRIAAILGTASPGAADLGAADLGAADLGAVQHTSGGSAANSCVVAAGLGARVGYLGKVADDEAGAHFRRDIEAAGIAFPSAALAGGEAGAGPATARCIILVTPDGQRTMNTYLGACTAFGPADVLAHAVQAARVTYLEGYLFDPPEAQKAFRLAVELAHAAGRKVALSLSDSFCVARHREAFRALVRDVDILFANQDEVLSLYETDDFERAADQVAAEVELAALTRGERGSVVLNGGTRIVVEARPTRVIDTTGAGDAYAAGFLAGLVSGRPLAECGRIGTVAASEVISHFGARPLADLRALAGI